MQSETLMKITTRAIRYCARSKWLTYWFHFKYSFVTIKESTNVFGSAFLTCIFFFFEGGSLPYKREQSREQWGGSAGKLLATSSYDLSWISQDSHGGGENWCPRVCFHASGLAGKLSSEHYNVEGFQVRGRMVRRQWANGTKGLCCPSTRVKRNPFN